MSGMHLVHIRPTFGTGGAEMRSVQIINQLGSRFRHTIVSLDGNFDAARHINANGVEYIPLENTGKPWQMAWRCTGLLTRLKADLRLTYNWGSIDAIIGNTFARVCPAIHTEDGFNADEAMAQIPRRVYTRRLFLPRVYRVVFPSMTLYRLARNVWKLPEKNLEFIANGIDLERFAPAEERKTSGELILGSVANLTPVKRQSLLIETFAAVAKQVPSRLLLAGHGPELESLQELAGRLGVAGAVEFLGLRRDVENVYRMLDVFVLSSKTEQMPLSVLEAMAAGLPVVSTDVGDIKDMVSPSNRPFIVPAEQLATALGTVASNGALRHAIGIANRAHCYATYNFKNMLCRYEALYLGAVSD